MAVSGKRISGRGERRCKGPEVTGRLGQLGGTRALRVILRMLAFVLGEVEPLQSLRTVGS